jgi:hypothetical protein
MMSPSAKTADTGTVSMFQGRQHEGNEYEGAKHSRHLAIPSRERQGVIEAGHQKVKPV